MEYKADISDLDKLINVLETKLDKVQVLRMIEQTFS